MAKRTSTSTGKRTRRTSGKTQRRTAVRTGQAFTGDGSPLLRQLARTFVGRLVIAGAVLALLYGINLWISGNQYELFYRLFGIELLLAAAIAFLLIIFRPDPQTEETSGVPTGQKAG